MSQAKILNSVELRRVLDYVATRKHSARNRAMLLLTHFAGMRVAEVASLRLNDVLNDVLNVSIILCEWIKEDYDTKRVVNEQNELINIKNDAFQTIVFINKI